MYFYIGIRYCMDENILQALLPFAYLNIVPNLKTRLPATALQGAAGLARPSRRPGRSPGWRVSAGLMSRGSRCRRRRRTRHGAEIAHRYPCHRSIPRMARSSGRDGASEGKFRMFRSAHSIAPSWAAGMSLTVVLAVVLASPAPAFAQAGPSLAGKNVQML